MLKPMSRMAKIVSVLATAQRHPARSAQMIRVRRPANIGADRRGAQNQRRQAPAREEKRR